MIPQKHQNIGIYGMGIEGKSLYSWFKRHGYKKIFCFDENSINSDPEEKLLRCHIVFRSPGVHPKKLIEKGVKKENISSSTQLFLELAKENGIENIIGVTGTKGKGTTSSLITEILKEDGRNNVFLGGNIGTPIFDFYDEIKTNDIVILELSSFQLYDTNISPQYAVLLRTDSEHLDWHSDIFDYRNAKKNLFAHQKKDDVLVYFGGSDIAKEMINQAPSRNKISVFSKDEKKWIDVDPELSIINYQLSIKKDLVLKTQNSKLFTTDIALRGKFHQENVLAAVAIAYQFDFKNEAIKKVLQRFTGLPMRCEMVGGKDGRYFYNDSFSTIPETTISALSTFNTPVYLILGGSEKNSDFAELSTYIFNHQFIKKIYLLGVTANRIMRLFEHIGIQHSTFKIQDSLTDIFDDFKKESQIGDSLLLSPGCASFGMFVNYKQRGEIFNDLVNSF